MDLLLRNGKRKSKRSSWMISRPNYYVLSNVCELRRASTAISLWRIWRHIKNHSCSLGMNGSNHLLKHCIKGCCNRRTKYNVKWHFVAHPTLPKNRSMKKSKNEGRLRRSMLRKSNSKKQVKLVLFSTTQNWFTMQCKQRAARFWVNCLNLQG